VYRVHPAGGSNHEPADAVVKMKQKNERIITVKNNELNQLAMCGVHVTV